MLQANKYVDIIGVSAKTYSTLFSILFMISTTCVFESAVYFSSVMIRKLNFAFMSGSSKQGNARRASMASNCVAPINSSFASL